MAEKEDLILSEIKRLSEAIDSLQKEFRLEQKTLEGRFERWRDEGARQDTEMKVLIERLTVVTESQKNQGERLGRQESEISLLWQEIKSKAAEETGAGSVKKAVSELIRWGIPIGITILLFVIKQGTP